MRRWFIHSAVAAALLAPTFAQAHFVWLVQTIQDGKPQVHAYFSEDAEADDPKFLDRLGGLVTEQVSKGEAKAIKLEKDSDSLTAPIAGDQPSIITGKTDLGVMNRGDAKFRLIYFAKGGPALENAAWKSIDTQKQLDLDVIPVVNAEGKLLITVLWKGQPVEKSEVNALVPGLGNQKAETNAQGQVTFETGDSGRYAIRARKIEETRGEQDGKAFDSIRYYSTVTFDLAGKKTVTAAKSPSASSDTPLAPLTPPVTSFGGAVVGGDLYVYGGNLGSAHSYNNHGQNHELRRLHLNGTGGWETVADGPALQGLSLVAYGNKLYRIGGFTAKNEEGADNDLWSQDSAAVFDIASGKWTDLPNLPEARSSHDAAVLGDTLYVVGGWKLAGHDNRDWHNTAWSLDLKSDKPEWKALPTPPFERRALAIAAHQGKIFVVGGMDNKGGPTTKTSVYDPKTQQWSEGPSIVGEPMAGFGCSAFANDDALFVSTSDANLQRLSDDGKTWEIVQELPRGRFFHRMLPIDDHHFVSVGGANMKSGKFEEVDVISVH
jgi:hypothetical protein